MSVQVIEKEGKPEWAVIPHGVYQQLVEDSEMLQDIQGYDEAKQALERGETLIPAEITFQIIDGKNPIQVWRQYLEISSQQLAETAGISETELLQIESDSYFGTTEVLAAIANALNLSLDDIITEDVNLGSGMHPKQEGVRSDERRTLKTANS
ncbi:MAG: XRE family transcriptional regulator [Candidatus Parabeggiatoa sp. nov. 1]|nr:MAG: XRE family transcriptional regulator [Gammaproteobacteria bacterium]